MDVQYWWRDQSRVSHDRWLAQTTIWPTIYSMDRHTLNLSVWYLLRLTWKRILSTETQLVNDYAKHRAQSFCASTRQSMKWHMCSLDQRIFHDLDRWEERCLSYCTRAKIKSNSYACYKQFIHIQRSLVSTI